MSRKNTGTINPVKDASTKPWFLASIIITLFLAGLLVWYLTFAFNFINSFKNQELAVERSSWKLLFYDQTLNMATRVCALSGSLKWRKTYVQTQPKLKKLLADIPNIIDSPRIRRKVEKLRGYHASLSRMEAQTFQLVSKGKKDQAANLLAGWSYTKNRIEFENTARELVDLVQKRITHKTSFQRTLSILIVAGIALCLAVLVLSWTRTIHLWRKQIETKKQAEAARQKSENDLRTLISNLPGIAFHCQYDQAWTMLFMSQEVFNVTGYPASDFLHNSVRSYASLIHPEDRSTVDQEVQDAVAADRHWEIEYRILHRDGTVRWVWERGQAIEDASGEVAYLNGVINEVTQRKLMEERLKELSIYDSLTGLYNRNFFDEEMHRLSTKEQLPIGLITCDVNGLKLINDTMGHEAGDALLKTCADILSQCFRDSDIIARIGGDEFVVLLPETGYEPVRDGCERIRRQVASYQERDPEMGLSISIGYAVMQDSSMDMNDLFKRADDAMYKDKLQRSHSSRSETVQALIKTMEARDHITDGHAGRLHTYAQHMGRALDLSDEQLNDLQLLARFHDLGKVGIPDSILFKPGRLTDEEFEEMKRHSEIGHRIALSLNDLAPIADYILKHHEHWDGRGYPLGLSGTDIPLECRILAIVDAYDAMTSQRPYKDPMSRAEAVEELQRCAGSQFDPDLVQLFVHILEDLESDELEVLHSQATG